jgi:hypothetical protein
MGRYMAPPLKPEVEFYVLTSTPMATWPLGGSETTWPQDVALIMLTGPIKAQVYNRAISVTEIIGHHHADR